MSLNTIVFWGITAAWLLEFVLFRPRTQTYTFQEPLGFDWVKFVMIVSSLSSLFLRNQSAFVITGLLGDVLEMGGLILYATGTTMRFAGSIALGPLYNRYIKVETNQPLVSHGIYRFVRHPMYVGLFLLIVAIPIYFQHALLIPLTLIAMFLVIHHRMNFEERIMEDVIGKRYVEWKRKHHRFFPHIVFQTKTSK